MQKVVDIENYFYYYSTILAMGYCMRELSKRQVNIIRYLETRLSRNGIRQLYAIFLSGLERPEDITKGLHEYNYCSREAKSRAAAVTDDELDDVLVKLALNWNRF